MRHQWDEGETFMDTIICYCEVCGGVRTRKRIAGLDYINIPGFYSDFVGTTRKGWRYEGTPRSCPGVPLWSIDEQSNEKFDPDHQPST